MAVTANNPADSVNLSVFVLVTVERQAVVMVRLAGRPTDDQFYLPGGELGPVSASAKVGTGHVARILQSDTGIILPAEEFRHVGTYDAMSSGDAQRIMAFAADVNRHAVMSQMRPQGRSRDVALLDLKALRPNHIEPEHYWLIVETLLKA